MAARNGSSAADEHELDRPAADDPAAEVDVARRPGRERDALLERVEHVLRGAADLAERGSRLQALRRVADARSCGPVAGGRDRDRRDAAGDERRLLVEAEREAEIDELAERARPPRLGAGLARRAARGTVSTRPARGERGCVAGELEPRRRRGRRSRRGRRPRSRPRARARARRTARRRGRRRRRRRSRGRAGVYGETRPRAAPRPAGA